MLKFLIDFKAYYNIYLDKKNKDKQREIIINKIKKEIVIMKINVLAEVSSLLKIYIVKIKNHNRITHIFKIKIRNTFIIPNNSIYKTIIIFNINSILINNNIQYIINHNLNYKLNNYNYINHNRIIK